MNRLASAFAAATVLSALVLPSALQSDPADAPARPAAQSAMPRLVFAAAAAPAAPQDMIPGMAPRGREDIVERMCSDLAAHLAGWSAFAMVKLDIAPTQRSAWASFVDQARASAEPVRQLCAERASPPAPFPRLDAKRRMAAAVSQSATKLEAAAEALAPALAEEQVRALDALLPGAVLPPPHQTAFRGPAIAPPRGLP